MDLSFPPFVPTHELTAWPADLAVLLVGIAARQGSSATAAQQTVLDTDTPAVKPFAPVDGSFNGAVAAALGRWKKGERGVHQPGSGDLQAAPVEATNERAASPAHSPEDPE